MKKIGLFISALFIAMTALIIFLSSVSGNGRWQHQTYVDEIRDQERHLISFTGTTKGGEEFYFSFVCFDPKSMALFHHNGPQLLHSQRSRGSTVISRIENEKPTFVGWRNSIETDTSAWRNGELFSLTAQEKSWQLDRGAFLDRNWIDTQSTKRILDIINGLGEGKFLLIEHDNDVSKVEPSRNFIKAYQKAKIGCGF